ncbi:MAG TPA: hypothetical protein VIW70_08485 [Rubrivivax sp.]
MTTFNPSAGHRPETPARAGSLRRTASSYLRALWNAMERFGQRRAARELLLAADRIQASRPELAAHLRALAREAANA